MRRAGTDRRIFTTVPSLRANTMSIANRMKKVCMRFDGAITSAWPGAKPVRPSRPRFRVALSSAGSTVVAIGLPVRTLVSR